MSATARAWRELWPELEPLVRAAQPGGRLPAPNAQGWIGPLHAPYRKDRSPSLSVKPDGPHDPGAYKDHGTSEGGSLADLARKLGYDPAQLAARVTPEPAVTLEAFCRQRRLDPERLRTVWGVREARYRGRPELVYPTELGIDRAKFLDGHKPKYGWLARGGRAHPYGLAQAAELGGELLCIVNGEPSVWAAHQAGVPAACFCGGEGKAPGGDVLEALRRSGFRRFSVTYDRDAAGRAGARAVVAALRAAGLEAVAVELPGELGEGADVDDLSRLVGDRLGEVLAGLPELPEPGAAEVGQTWPPRQPLPAPEAVPTLPPELVPEPLRDWLTDAAAHACIPLELVAAPALVVAGSLVGRGVGIRPEDERNAWTVVPNLWGAIVAPPGMLKSHAIGEAAAPLGPLVAEARAAFAEASDAAEAERAALTAELARLKGRRTGEVDRTAIADVMRRLSGCEPSERRYVTSDATPEKLGEILARNPCGVLLLRDEIAGWLATFERPGREGERAFYLEAWGGVGSFTVDRIGRGTVHVPALCVSVVGGIQPGRLSAYQAEALGGGGGADGLLQRFQLLVWPDGLPPYSRTQRAPDRAARERAFAVYRNLARLEAASVGATLLGTGGVPCLAFDRDAQSLFDDWRDELELRLRGDELQRTPAFCAHLAKYRSLMPALALLFYLIEVTAETFVGAGSGVPLHHARCAAAWCDYLEAHARKLYRGELERDREAARALARKIEAGEVAAGCAPRDLYRRGWSGLVTPEAVWQALVTLERLGWVRVDELPTGGRPSYAVNLHPELKGGR